MKLLLLALALQAAAEQPVLSSQIDATLAGGTSRLEFEWKLVDDAEFLRRLLRDLAGREPSEEELKAFAADPAPGKRARKIDQVLDSDAFAAFSARHTARLSDDAVEIRDEGRGEQEFPALAPRRLESKVRIGDPGIARPVFLFGGEAGEDKKRSASLARFSTAWVFRLLGPEETVDDWRAEFLELLKKAKQ